MTFIMRKRCLSLLLVWAMLWTLTPSSLLFAADERFSVSVTASEGGSVEADKEQAEAGDEVKLSAVAAEGYQFQEWQIVKGSPVLQNPGETELLLTMPAEDIEMQALFAPLFSIHIVVDFGDETEEQFGQAPYQHTVRAELNAVDGYVFKGWQVVGGDVSLSSADQLLMHFVMPAENVELAAYYRKLLYTDISEHKFFAEIQQASEEGWLPYEAGELDPNAAVSRADYIRLLAAAFPLQLPEDAAEIVFTDIEGHVAEDAIRLLAGLQLVSGMSPTEFGPDRYITREQAVAMLLRVCAYLGIPELEPLEEPSLDLFHDRDTISDWALSSVQRAVKLNIDTGRSASYFSAQELLGRAEGIAQIVHARGLGRSRLAD